MHTLPPEILCAVFACLDFANLLQASHVCRYWRSASLANCSALWSSIRTCGRRAGALKAQLDRARDVPVSLDVRFDEVDHFDETLVELATHLHHTERLQIWLDRDHGARPGHLLRLMNALARDSAPLLETLELTASVHWTRGIQPAPFPLRPDFLNGHAPRLLRLKLDGDFQILEPVPALHRVTHAALFAPHFTREEIRTLEHLPALQSLTFATNNIASPNALSSLFPRVLQHVYLPNRPTSVGPASAALAFHPLRVPQLYTDYYPTVFENVLPESPAECRSLSMLHSFRTVVRIREHGGRAVAVTDMPAKGIYVPFEVFAHVVEFTVHSHWLARKCPLLPLLPQVEQLTVILLPHTIPLATDLVYMRLQFADGGDAQPRAVLLHCPRLVDATVAVDYYYDGLKRTNQRRNSRYGVSGEDVRDFFANNVRFEAKPLRRLIFRGITPLGGGLQDVAAEVRVDSRFLAHEFDSEDSALLDAWYELV